MDNTVQTIPVMDREIAKSAMSSCVQTGVQAYVCAYVGVFVCVGVEEFNMLNVKHSAIL